MDTCFVTGATGFIGARLVERLLERGYRVRALSRRADPPPPPGLEQVADLWQRPGVELVRGDLHDRHSLSRGMQGCRYVFHLAAYAKNWAPDAAVYYRANVEGMRHVFAAASEQGAERIVWTSSVVTFGPTPRGVVGTEAMPRARERFFTEYERTKTLAEREALREAARGLPVVIVNPTRVYGPGYLTEGNALAHLIDAYDRGRVPVLLNRGVNVGNYVLVDDVAAGHLLALTNGRLGERYILGGDNVSLRDFFRTIDRVSGRRRLQIPLFSVVPLLFAAFQQFRARRFGVYPTITPGWVRTFLADWAYDSGKARRELGYRPTPLEEGIRITYQWLLGVRKECPPGSGPDSNPPDGRHGCVP